MRDLLQDEIRDIKRRLKALETSSRVPKFTTEGGYIFWDIQTLGTEDLIEGSPGSAWSFERGDYVWTPVSDQIVPEDSWPFLRDFQIPRSGRVAIHYSMPELHFTGGASDTEVYLAMWARRLPDSEDDPFEWFYPADEPANDLEGFGHDEPYPTIVGLDNIWIRGDGSARTSGFTFFEREPGWYTVELAVTWEGTKPSAVYTGWYSAMAYPA